MTLQLPLGCESLDEAYWDAQTGRALEEDHTQRSRLRVVSAHAGERAVSATGVGLRPPVRFFSERRWNSARAERVRQAGMQMFPVEEFAGWIACCSRLPLHPEPRPHDGSDARYSIDGALVGSNALFLQHLIPHGRTSEHLHLEPLQGELYFLLAGAATVDGKPLGQYMYTGPGEHHQVVAGESGALIAAVLLGAADVPREHWHTRL